MAAWFAYNQYAKNKKTDAKIDQWKKEKEEDLKTQASNTTKVYGELWRLLHELDADRVYIVQPHPLSKYVYLTVHLEVKSPGASSCRMAIQALPIADVAQFIPNLIERDFVYYDDVVSQIKDKKMAAVLSTYGTQKVAICKLSDDKHDWVGSLFVDYLHHNDIRPSTLREALHSTAAKIQFNLPEIK